MNVRFVTNIFIFVSILIIGGYDIWAWIAGGTEGTISHIIMSSSFNHPMIAVIGGVLVGHFWWRIKCPNCDGDAGKNLSKESKDVSGKPA